MTSRWLRSSAARSLQERLTSSSPRPPPPFLYQFMVTCIENGSVRSFGQWIIKSKVYLLIIHARTEKKVQDCDYVFESSTKFQRRMNGFVKADTCRQLSVCLHVFCGILFALKPFCDYSLCFYTQSAFYPWSAFCGTQSAVCVLH